jgi:manganese oxidase
MSEEPAGAVEQHTGQVFMKQIYLASLLIYVVAVAGCGGGGSSPMTTTPTPTPTPGGATPVGIQAGASFLSTTAYLPNPITITVGTTITWTNNDNVSHDVTSQNNLFFSGNMAPGQTFSQKFQSTGSFPYYCTIHPMMVGTVTVQ